MSYVIDRRLNGKNKSTVNRQRFLRRYRDHIKKAVEEAVGRRSITDMEHGEQISIPGRDIDEPVNRPSYTRATRSSPAANTFSAPKAGPGVGAARARQAIPARAWMSSCSRSPKKSSSNSCSKTSSCRTWSNAT